VRSFREALTKAGAIEVLFRRFDEVLKMSGYLAMGGQIVDATIVAAPKQRNTNEVAGRSGHSRFRIQEPRLDRPLPWTDPELDGYGRCCL
jgi:hypothetical protein